MAVFRSYLSAQASLINRNGTNASRNPIIELSYAGSLDPGSVKLTRFVFTISFEALRAEVIAGRLRRADVKGHEIFFKNVVALVPELLGGEVEDAQRGSGVQVFLRQLPTSEAFIEGKGLDYLYFPGLGLQSQAPQQAANWYYRQNGVAWSTPGGWDPTTGITLGSCLVSEGTEDLRFDVSGYVQSVLFDGLPEHPLMLQLDAVAEAALGAQRSVITFFSRHTHHFFEPFLETISEPNLYERRDAVPLDEPAGLLLQVPANLATAVMRVNLYDAAGAVVSSYAGGQIEERRPGVFGVNFTLDSTAVEDGSLLTDEWLFQQGVRVKRITQEFTVVDRLLLPLADSFDKVYSLTLAGLRHNEVVSRSQAVGVRRVVVSAKALVNGQVQCVGSPSGVRYRIYYQQGKEQQDVVSWTDCYQVGGGIFFELDSRWMIPQYYLLEVVALSSDGQQQGAPLVIKFRIVN
jgi:hypothetical protein